ncbi:DUF4286 family protein [Chromobacterium sp. IIBBL 290-4]|uniref:DUF4286 family protein n=1 Tax=Chromobacterium sp. IIBBL 290-4 TaxID=2953890 RepID=UPI0020B8B06C|nr:DUF4286 family protein [Chromobacterium sp. IIBBL 290-4]UTH76637.1 hypothetical protein NKT35_11270 [Chromobacterium sp. IIBBL 290-4]
MLYFVECSYADPGSEAEWNRFYNEDKLPALLAVPGFLNSQRFQAVGHDGPAYLAIHTLAGPETLDSDAYRRNGGGNFASWQTHIFDWRRNLYLGAQAPAIGERDYLAISEQGPEALLAMGAQPDEIQAAGLERSTASRWLAAWRPVEGQGAADLAADLRLYAPLTARLFPGQSLARQTGLAADISAD